MRLAKLVVAVVHLLACLGLRSGLLPMLLRSRSNLMRLRQRSRSSCSLST